MCNDTPCPDKSGHHGLRLFDCLSKPSNSLLIDASRTCVLQTPVSQGVLSRVERSALKVGLQDG